MGVRRVSSHSELHRRSKPGYSVSSVIHMNEVQSPGGRLKRISFPPTASNSSPSALIYDETRIQELSSQLPLLPGSQYQLPFTVYVTDPLYRFPVALT